jgi:hypothetical protein
VEFKWLTVVSDGFNVPFGRSSLIARRTIGADATVCAQRRPSSCTGDVITVNSDSCIRPLVKRCEF